MGGAINLHTKQQYCNSNMRPTRILISYQLGISGGIGELILGVVIIDSPSKFHMAFLVRC